MSFGARFEQFDDETNERLMRRRRTSGRMRSHASRPTRTRSSPVTAQTTSTPFPGTMSRRYGRSADCSTSTTTASALRRERTRPRYRHRHRVLQGRRLLARGQIEARAAREHDVSMPRPGWFEHDAEETWWSDVRGDLLASSCRTGARGWRQSASPASARASPHAMTTGAPCGRQSSTASTPGPRLRSSRAHRALRRRRDHSARRVVALQPGARPQAPVAAAERAGRLGAHPPLAHGEQPRRRTADRRMGARPPLRQPVRPACTTSPHPTWNRRVGARRGRARLPLPPLAWPAEVVGTVQPRGADATGLPTGNAGRSPARSTPGPRRRAPACAALAS